MRKMPPLFGGGFSELTGYQGLAIFSIAQDVDGQIYIAVGESDELDGGESEEVELWVFRGADDPPREIKRHMDHVFPGSEEESRERVFEA